MANRRDIKRRIISVVNTQKITKAMKLVAAAKFSKASQSVMSAKPYSKAFTSMVDRVLSTLDSSELDKVDSPLISMNSPQGPSSLDNSASRSPSKKLLILLSTDRGLCGGLNSNLFKSTASWILGQKPGVGIDVVSFGKKGTSWAKKRKALNIVLTREKTLDKPTYQKAKELVSEVLKIYNSEAPSQYGEVVLAYSEFKNALTQTPSLKKILPVSLGSDAEVKDSKSNAEPKFQGTAPIFEPSSAELIGPMLQTRLELSLFQALLEHSASEHGSRMTAMDSATTNAAEVRKKLTLQYNRARQAAITKELIEIVSGAEAL